MATIAGLRGTGDWGNQERPTDFRETILWLEPNGQAPLQALMSKMSSQPTTDPEFSWWEEKLTHNRLEVKTEAAAGVTTLAVDTDQAWACVKGDILMVESVGGLWANEILKVVEDPTAGNALKVARGFAGTTAAVIPAGTFIIAIGTSFAEGSLAPKSATRNPVKLNNYCQIFKKSYEITKTADATKARTGSALANDKKRRMFDYYRDVEMAFIYGRKSETVGENGKPERTTGGLLNFITTNRTQFGGGVGQTELTEDSLIDFFASVFNYDGQGAGNQRIAFVGNTALTKINKLARDSQSTRINFDKQVTQVYGMNFTRWVLPQGEIFFKTHPLFNVHPELSKAMMVLNPKGIKERVLRATKPENDIQQVGQDSIKGQWIGEFGLEVNHEETMAFAGGIA